MKTNLEKIEAWILPWLIKSEQSAHDRADDAGRDYEAEQQQLESFWAGRNHAMRLSARAAA